VTETAAEMERAELVIAVAAHELKTPLSIIKWCIEAIAKECDCPTVSRIEQIRRQIVRMDVLIDTVLAVAYVATGERQFPRDRTNIVALVKDVAEDFEHVQGACKLEMHFADASAYANVNPPRIAQVINNLLTNACKYGGPGLIDVYVGRDDSSVVINVRDHGRGLKDGHEDAVFDKFYRENQMGPGGLGLGLWICRELINAHGGTITAQNAKTGGALFTVKLPLAQ
jgi:signal transduction histidine kinase